MCPGREIQVGYLVDRALPSIEIIPKSGFYDYENKYQPGAAEEITPAPIPPEWEAQLAQDTKTVFDALGLSVYSRADFIVDEGGTPWFLEINTLPGMTPTSLVPQEAAAAGISYDELCETHRECLPEAAGKAVTERPGQREGRMQQLWKPMTLREIVAGHRRNLAGHYGGLGHPGRLGGYRQP